MKNGEVIYAAERFIARGQQQLGDSEIDGSIIYINAPRSRHDIIETAVMQSSSVIVILLESNGHRKEAELILERAYQFAEENIPTNEIREMLDEYLKQLCPNLYRIYKISNR